MEIQLKARESQVKKLRPSEIRSLPAATLLDVREEWEKKVCGLAGALPLEDKLLTEILSSWDRNRNLVCFCHFGIRSADAAIYLAEEGFKNVFVMEGGIDGWSVEVDPDVPRYDGSWC